MQPTKGYVFQNWAKTFQSSPKFTFSPTSQDQIIEVLKFARSKNLKVRVVGSGHSPSDIACTNDVMIRLDKYNKIIEVDQENCEVTVESGITLHELNENLFKYGLGIPSLGSISEQTISGAISTGTHGTGKNFGILSTIVTSLDLITSDGKVLPCSENYNKDIFKASLCSLGCLGIISKLTLKVEKAFKLESIQSPKKLDEVLSKLDTLIGSVEHFRFWWFPHTDDAIIWGANRSQKNLSIQSSSWIKDRFFGFHFLEFLLYLSSFSPSLVPFINKFYFSSLFSKQEIRVDQSHRIFNFDCLFKQYVTEWAIPTKNTVEAIQRLKKFIEENNIHAHFPIEVRFVQEDDIWLSPAYGQDTCYIGIIMYRPYGKDIVYDKYWEGYEQIMYSLGGRPHWAKAHPLEESHFHELYPKFQEFLDIRKKLDPIDLFVNDYISRHFLKASQSKPLLKSKL